MLEGKIFWRDEFFSILVTLHFLPLIQIVKNQTVAPDRYAEVDQYAMAYRGRPLF